MNEYASHFCEENVYWLALKHHANEACNESEAFVIFISNLIQTVPIWRQKASKNNDPVCWDYHVIFIICAQSRSKEQETEVLVYNLDSLLSYPCIFSEYVECSFQPNFNFDSKFKQ
jgi:hypothetical protein